MRPRLLGWPVCGLHQKKLKLGIDLSGGTILVYEARESAPGFNMDELIAALKKRADPEGVKEIPIRKIGGNRIEIILPQASNEEVEEVKKMLTDVGSLEFRILANGKHDQDVIDRALASGWLSSRRSGYKWARLGEISTGTNPSFTSDTITDAQQTWKKDLYAGTEVAADRQGFVGQCTRPRSVKVRRNTANTLILDKPHGLKSIAVLPGRIQPQPHQRAATPSNPGPNDSIVREEKVAPGRIETWILCNLDRAGTGSDREST